MIILGYEISYVRQAHAIFSKELGIKIHSTREQLNPPVKQVTSGCCIRCVPMFEYMYTIATRVLDYVLYYIDTIPVEANMCLCWMYCICNGSESMQNGLLYPK